MPSSAREHVPPRQRHRSPRDGTTGGFAWWREEVCQRFLPLRVEQLEGSAFRATLDEARAGAVTLTRISSTPQVVRRGRRELAQGGTGDIYVLIQRDGTSAVAAETGLVRLKPDEVAVLDTARPYELRFPGDFTQWCLVLPRHRLDGAGVLDSIHGRKLDGGGAAQQALLAQCELVDRLAEELPAHVNDELGNAMSTLLKVLCRPTVRHGGARQDKIRRLLAFIEAASDGGPVSPAAAAAYLGVSVRYVHELLTDTGATFAEHVRNRRVARAAELLSASSVQPSEVAKVAHQVGFQDLSTFNRAFKRRLGMTPTQYRLRSALHADAGALRA